MPRIIPVLAPLNFAPCTYRYAGLPCEHGEGHAEEHAAKDSKGNVYYWLDGHVMMIKGYCYDE